MSNGNKLIIVDETTLKDKIYTIRGWQVMLDFDLAHKIGVGLALRLRGVSLKAVVAIHLNTCHFHNHFCLNSVSFRYGYK